MMVSGGAGRRPTGGARWSLGHDDVSAALAAIPQSLKVTGRLTNRRYFFFGIIFIESDDIMESCLQFFSMAFIFMASVSILAFFMQSAIIALDFIASAAEPAPTVARPNDAASSGRTSSRVAEVMIVS
jgi:hypothetical protein